jgi:hypothetical protein
LKQLFRDQGGSASVLALFMIMCFFALGALVADVAKHYCIKTAVKYKLNLACRSAAAQINEEELQNANLVIDEARAAQAFYDVLKTNLKLDDGMIPQAGSILNSGPVQVAYFRVVSTEETPFTYAYDDYVETVNRPAVTAIISFPVKSGTFTRMAGGPEETTMYCHVTAAPELISRPIDQI